MRVYLKIVKMLKIVYLTYFFQTDFELSAYNQVIYTSFSSTMGVKKSMFLKESQKPFIITGLQQPAGVSNVLKPVTLLQELTTLFFFFPK